MQEERGINPQLIVSQPQWFSNSKLNYTLIYRGELIVNIKLLRGDMWKLKKEMEGTEMMMHIFLNLPEAYKYIAENKEGELDDE